MARKSSSGSLFSMALLAVGGYFAYENWPAISAWFGSFTATAGTAVAAATGATYPNSPVPVSFSTMQTFVDSSGNQWQYSTQTGQWVIATQAPAAPSPGTVVATAPTSGSAAQIPPAPVPAVSVPQSAGTVVSTAPPTSTAPALPMPQSIVWQPNAASLVHVAPIVERIATAPPSPVSENRVYLPSGGFRVNNR